MTVSLSELSPGQQGRVERVSGEGQVFKRLLDMGMTPGAHVEMRRVAPLGDPIEVKLRGYHLSLRKNEASRIAIAIL
jgi:Fe2+ transport system protein FeoA